jgi:ribonuclease D
MSRTEIFHPAIIDDPDDLINAINEISKHSVIAIDLESDMYLRGGKNICLIQIGTPTQQYYLLDSHSIDISPIKTILEDSSIEKLFFDGVQDIQMMKQHYHCQIQNIFDVAHAFLILQSYNQREKSLGFLCQKYLGFTLEKAKSIQRADWCKRPLTPKMIQYATSDVAYLHPLSQFLKSEIKNKGWNQDIQRFFASFQLIEPINPIIEEEFAFLKLKGFNQLEHVEKILLKILNKIRIDWSKKRKRPPHYLLSNTALIELTKKRPRNFKNISDLNNKELLRFVDREKKIAKQIINDIQETEKSYEQGHLSYETEVEKLTKLYNGLSQQNLHYLRTNLTFTFDIELSQFRLRLKTLKKWRKRLAEQIDLPENLVLSRYTLQELSTLNYEGIDTIPLIPGIDQSFQEKYGPKLYQIMKLK